MSSEHFHAVVASLMAEIAAAWKHLEEESTSTHESEFQASIVERHLYGLMSLLTGCEAVFRECSNRMIRER